MPLSLLCAQTIGDIASLIWADDIFRLLASGNDRLSKTLYSSVRHISHRYDLTTSRGWPTSLLAFTNMSKFSSETCGSEHVDDHLVRDIFSGTIPAQIMSIIPQRISSLRLAGGTAHTSLLLALTTETLPPNLDEIHVEGKHVLKPQVVVEGILSLKNISRITFINVLNVQRIEQPAITFDIRNLSQNLTRLWISGRTITFVDKDNHDLNSTAQTRTATRLPPMLETLFIRYGGTTLELFEILPENLKYLDCDTSHPGHYTLSSTESAILPKSLTTLFMTESLYIPQDDSDGFYSNLPKSLVNVDFGTDYLHYNASRSRRIAEDVNGDEEEDGDQSGVDILSTSSFNNVTREGNLTPNVISMILGKTRAMPLGNVLDDVGYLDILVDNDGDINRPINLPKHLMSMRISADIHCPSSSSTRLLNPRLFCASGVPPRFPPSLVKLVLMHIWVSNTWHLSDHTNLRVLKVETTLIPDDFGSNLPASLRMLSILVCRNTDSYRNLARLLLSLPPRLVDFRATCRMETKIKSNRNLVDSDFQNLPKTLRFLKIPQCGISKALTKQLIGRLNVFYVGHAVISTRPVQ